MMLFEINSREGFPFKTEELLLFFLVVVINVDLFMQYENVKQKLERADACLCCLKITEVEDA